MGCLGSSQLIDQEQLFERLYTSMRLKDALNNAAASETKRKELVLYIYYNISTDFLKSLKAQIVKMEQNIRNSQVRVVSLEKLAQFVKTMETFWNEVIQTKNRIKEFTIQSEKQLIKLNDSINMKIKTKIQEIDNKIIIKRSQIQEQPLKINESKKQNNQAQNKQSKLKNNEIQRDIQASCEIQVEQNTRNFVEFSSQIQESRLTRQQLDSVQTYSYPMNIIQFRQRQQQFAQLTVPEYKSQQIEVVCEKEQQKQVEMDIQNKILTLKRLLQQKQNLAQSLRGHIKQLLQQNKNINEEMHKKSQQMQFLTESLQKLNQYNLQLTSTNQSLQSQLQLKINELATLHKNTKAENFDAAIDSSNSSKRSCSSITQGEYFAILKYFSHSNVLPGFQKSFLAAKLRRQLAEMFTTKIRSTKLIYAFDPLSQLHYDRYIQNRQNLFVLIKIDDLTYIGGFAGQIDQNQEISNSFLFSIGAQKLPIKLVAKEKVKKIDYELGFLNFGNGEIKIKCRSLSLNCNVNGIYTKYFAQTQFCIQMFLGDSERSRQAKGYEIYEIQFDNCF